MTPSYAWTHGLYIVYIDIEIILYKYILDKDIDIDIMSIIFKKWRANPARCHWVCGRVRIRERE